MIIENKNTANDTKAKPVRAYSLNHLNIRASPPTNDANEANAKIVEAVGENLFSFLKLNI